ncbi:MAG: acetylglutamate kinase [Flavobacteriales bacterium]|mgnify:CR=1 FL=1|nr:acetylglutamate kinase [Flavobacteriales bacterium]|tara:strand:- start:5014 stop:5778 length:765 start_codon:yes stop_codon:yes gene_type:complete
MIKVIKVGGGIIEQDDNLNTFLNSFSKIKGPKVLVHGGGRLATKVAEDIGYKTTMVEGRRVTDKKMLEIVTMVYGGLANKRIVAILQSKGTNAMGLSGADGSLITAHKRPVEKIDYGWVGDIDGVNTNLLIKLIHSNIVPVIAPLSHDGNGNILNTNADTIASEISKALAKKEETHLILGFELDGVLKDFNDKSSVIEKINPQSFEELKSEGIISEGMIPKLSNAFNAIDAGVTSVRICNALKIGDNAGTLISK